MDVFFVPVRASEKIVLDEKQLGMLPERVCLAASIQFAGQLPEVAMQLQGKGRKASLVQARHAAFPGQMLGCGWEGLKYDEKADAFLYIGDGNFHPRALLMAVRHLAAGDLDLRILERAPRREAAAMLAWTA